jgi:hypothetical protein
MIMNQQSSERTTVMGLVDQTQRIARNDTDDQHSKTSNCMRSGPQAHGNLMHDSVKLARSCGVKNVPTGSVWLWRIPKRNRYVPCSLDTC